MRPFQAARVAHRSRFDSRIGGMLLLMLLVMALQAVTVPPDGGDAAPQLLTSSGEPQDDQLLLGDSMNRLTLAQDGAYVPSVDALQRLPDAGPVLPLLAHANQISFTIVSNVDHTVALHRVPANLPPDDSVMDDDSSSDSSTDFSFGSL